MSKPFIQSIRLQNLLSYGPTGEELPLLPLNVLIGPNASGKSNLVEVLSLLAATSGDIRVPIRQGGGVAEWLWKGSGTGVEGSISVILDCPENRMPLRYRLAFSDLNGRFSLVDEVIENEEPQPGHERPYFFYAYQEGRPALNVRLPSEGGGSREERQLQREDISPEKSILSQRRDPDAYPELTYIARSFERMAFYREWNLGRDTAPRRPQSTDLPSDYLLEDGGNLGLVLNDLFHRPQIKERALDRLRKLYDAVRDVTTRIQGGTVQVFFHEEGLSQPVPATRLSDGTLRYLCLMAILLHPDPPPVVCIEEPELGLHPDVLSSVAEMLLEASNRTQLIVTTQSDGLVDALTDYPEYVVVSERGFEGTELRRLDEDRLREWLEHYRLGELWQMGEIGGNPG